MKCYYCKNEITNENQSDEHIIPNALGGRLSSTNLLCKKHNDELGKTVDIELVRQLGFVADIIGVKRDRLKKNIIIKVISKEGEPTYVGERLKPKPVLTFPLKGQDKLLTLAVKRGDLAEAASKKKKELEKAYGEKLTYTEHQKTIGETLYLANNLTKKPGEIGFGGKNYFRAIGKIALNYLLYVKPEITYSDDIIALIRGETNTNNNCIFRYYPDHYMIHNIEDEEISHLLYLEGSSEKGVLYGYLELFNLCNHVIVFDRDYIGKAFIKNYCFDTVKGCEIDKNINLKLTRQHLLDMDVISSSHQEGHQKKWGKIRDKLVALQQTE